MGVIEPTHHASGKFHNSSNKLNTFRCTGSQISALCRIISLLILLVKADLSYFNNFAQFEISLVICTFRIVLVSTDICYGICNDAICQLFVDYHMKLVVMVGNG